MLAFRSRFGPKWQVSGTHCEDLPTEKSKDPRSWIAVWQVKLSGHELSTIEAAIQQQPVAAFSQRKKIKFSKGGFVKRDASQQKQS